MGQKMTVLVSHPVSTVLEQKGNHWLSPSRFLNYQAILAESDDINIQVTNVVNPVSLLEGKTTTEPIVHDCLETTEAVYSSHPDLKEESLLDTEDWFTDGSSFVKQDVFELKRRSGFSASCSDRIYNSALDFDLPTLATISNDDYQTILMKPTSDLPVPAGQYILTGTDTSNKTALTVIPQSVTVDNPKVIEVTVKALFPPVELDTDTPIANLTPIEVGENTWDSMPLVQWTQSILVNRPMLTCSVFFPNSNQCVQVKGLINTGADITIFAETDWPKEWSTTKPCINIKGVGGAQSPLQSVCTLLIEGPECKTTSTRPYVLNIPMTHWGRDIIGQWDIHLTTSNLALKPLESHNLLPSHGSLTSPSGYHSGP
ncbi:hypothetical protein BTVI_58618 [Pitangus sulphuratus]|nr:hypothetical protein BTVI_58618 [Pitangus sulphuratus]